MTTKPTAQEMLTAADILERCSQGIAHSPVNYEWCARDLRTEAQHRAEEEQEEAEREKLVEELARDMQCQSFDVPIPVDHETYWHVRARKLIDAGWRKGD